MGLIGEWRAARERQRQAECYLRGLRQSSDTADVDWLTMLTHDRELAERELGFARRAVGLIVAERDALDDRTASEVARAMNDVIDAERRRSASLANQWLARRKAYAAAMASRGHLEPPMARLGRVLLAGAGIENPSSDAVIKATAFVQAARAHANEALRAVFGAASLPEDVRPSAIRH